MSEQICYVCGAQMETFDVIQQETGKKVAEEICCPNEWMESHTHPSEI
jgi:hypothetical protein